VRGPQCTGEPSNHGAPLLEGGATRYAATSATPTHPPARNLRPTFGAYYCPVSLRSARHRASPPPPLAIAIRSDPIAASFPSEPPLPPCRRSLSRQPASRSDRRRLFVELRWRFDGPAGVECWPVARFKAVTEVRTARVPFFQGFWDAFVSEKARACAFSWITATARPDKPPPSPPAPLQRLLIGGRLQRRVARPLPPPIAEIIIETI
jgi:hypothetical protein